MKFHQLNRLINIFKKNIKCSACGKPFSSSSVDIVDLYENECFIEAECESCHNIMNFDFNVEEMSKMTSKKVLNTLSQSTVTEKSEITDKEVEDIIETLKTHKGSVRDLFQPKNK